MKGPKRRKAKVDTPVEELDQKQTLEHYKAVQIEDFQSKIDLVVENMSSIEGSFRKEIDDIRSEMNQRLSVVEGAVRRHGAQLKILGEIAEWIGGDRHDEQE